MIVETEFDFRTRLRADLLDVILHGAATMPRSQQAHLGPSDAGHPCDRKIAYALTGAPQINVQSDPLKALIGTAFHVLMDEFLGRMNVALGRTRYLGEQRVVIEPGVLDSGTCDCLDLDTMTVIDWKLSGDSVIDKAKRAQVSDQYRTQRQMYGFGWARMGLPIRRVANLFIPRSGILEHSVLDVEPYDESVTLRALDRLRAIKARTLELDVAGNPEAFAQIEQTPETCNWCGYWTPNPNSPYQCRGWSGKSDKALDEWIDSANEKRPR